MNCLYLQGNTLKTSIVFRQRVHQFCYLSFQMSTAPDAGSGTCWSDLVDENQTSGLAETSAVLDEDTTPEDVVSSLNALSLDDDKTEAYTRVHQPAPRLDKSHGFMRFIVSLMF